MIKKIYYTSSFLKSIKKLSLKEKKLIQKREKIFRKNPFDKRLKTHKLKGRLKGLYSFSITYSQRILFEFTKEGEVIFYEIGGHEIY